jgi:hypothetical protein
MQRQHGERWAGWATQVDMRADIERIMCRLAEKYGHSLKHLVAPYHLTTQVSRIDAAKIVGADPFRWYRNYALPVLDDLRYEFAEAFLESHSYTPSKPSVSQPQTDRRIGRFTSPYLEWRAYQRGNTAPADALLDRYTHTPCLIQALQAQLDGKTYVQAAEHYGRKHNSFKKHMKRAARLLKDAYAA